MMPAPPPGGMPPGGPPQGPPPPPPGPAAQTPTPSIWDRFLDAIMGSGALRQAAQTGAPGAPPPGGPQDPTQLQNAVNQYMMNMQKTNSPMMGAGPAGPMMPPPPKALGEPPKKKKSQRYGEGKVSKEK